MTVPSNNRRREYDGNGLAKVFNGPMAYTREHIHAYIIANGITTEIAGSNFTVERYGYASGTRVTLATAPVIGEKLLILRTVPYTQETDITNQGAFLPETLEKGLDSISMQVQQLSDRQDRTPYFSDLYAGVVPDMRLPFPDPGRGIGWNADGSGFRNIILEGAGDLTLRNDLLDPTAGADLVAYTSGKSVGEKLSEISVRLSEEVSITDFGGVDNGVFDNSPAMIAARNYLGGVGIVKLPKLTLGRYYFSSDQIGALTVSADPGVSMVGAVALNTNSKFDNGTPVEIFANNTKYQIPPDFKRPAAEKDVFMSAADADHTEVVPLATNTGGAHEAIQMLSSDTFVAIGGGDVVADGPRVIWQNMLTDGTMYASTYGIQPGEELTVAFRTAGAYDRCAVVKYVDGYALVYFDRFGNTHIASKGAGVAATDTTFIPEGSQTHLSYRGDAAMWSIRIYDRRRWSVLFNGVEVTGILTTPRDIRVAGFGCRAVVGITQVDTQGWVITRRGEPIGKRSASVLVCGDSISADFYGSWTHYFREYVDGSGGVRVGRLLNYAVSGDLAGQQRDKLQTLGTQGSSHVIICVATNDIQGGSVPAETAGVVEQMIDFCQANFAIPIVWIPFLWYPRALTPGGNQGENTNRYNEGAEHRARILRLCANKGVKCVDMTKVTGPVLAAFLADPRIDPFVRDNIHPTAFAAKVIAHTLARAFLGSYLGRYTKRKEEEALPASGLRNGWTNAGQGATVRITDDGEVRFSGILTAGTVTNATVIYVLPEHLRPVSTVRQLVASSINGAVFLNIVASGEISIYNATGATYVALDGMGWRK